YTESQGWLFSEPLTIILEHYYEPRFTEAGNWSLTTEPGAPKKPGSQRSVNWFSPSSRKQFPSNSFKKAGDDLPLPPDLKKSSSSTSSPRYPRPTLHDKVLEPNSR